MFRKQKRQRPRRRWRGTRAVRCVRRTAEEELPLGNESNVKKRPRKRETGQRSALEQPCRGQSRTGAAAAHLLAKTASPSLFSPISTGTTLPLTHQQNTVASFFQDQDSPIFTFNDIADFDPNVWVLFHFL